MGRRLKNLPNKKIIGMIRRIRTRNNKNWMDLLSLALSSKPRKARKIIQQITLNDRQISSWTARLH